MGYESSIGAGWKNLVTPLIEEANRLNAKIHQIKEKFGLLTFYYSWESPPTNNIEQEEREQFRILVEDTQMESAGVCEECGAPGQPGGIGWTKTLCNIHHIARIGKRL